MEVDGLFDRDGEAAHLATALAAATGGRGGLVAIEGDAGIGKTRLLRHVRSLAERQNLPVLTARCAELEREYPFGVVRQLLELRVDDGAFVGRRRRHYPRPAPPMPSILAPNCLLLHGLYWLTVNLEAAVILVDDVHHADAVSLRYLAYLAVRLEDLPLLVVVTLRSGADDGLVHDVLASADATVLQPGLLGVPAVTKVLEQALEKPVEATFAEACHALAAGNPLFVHAVAAAVAGAGIEPIASHVDALSTLDTPMVQRRVDAVLRRLPADARAIAETVALLGPRAPVGVVAALAGIDLVTAADAVGELTRLGLLERDDDAAGFVHPLVATAVYESMPAGRRSLAHQRAAQLLAERGVEPERCAAHLLKVVPGLTGDALPLLRRAAEAALARGSPEAALAFLRRCLAEDLEPALRDELTDRAAAVAMQVDLLQAVNLLELMRDRPEAAGSCAGAWPKTWNRRFAMS